jgi:probable rRNA maturation factor
MAFLFYGHEKWTPSEWKQIRRQLRLIEKSVGLLSTDVSIAFLSDADIADLNLTFRGNPCPTDVLSFPSEPATSERMARGLDEKDYLGDIAVSLDSARRQSRDLAHSLSDEIGILVVHAMMHLVGLDHERSIQEARLQAECEMTLLDAAGINPVKALSGRALA